MQKRLAKDGWTAHKGHGKQSGDPRKGAAAIVDMVERGDSPLRLPPGRDCIERLNIKIAMLQSSRDYNQEIALSTDF